jgi:hypothetical protein
MAPSLLDAWNASPTCTGAQQITAFAPVAPEVGAS